MFYKIGTPKYSEAANGDTLWEKVFLNTFCHRAPPLAASQYFLNSRESSSARVFYKVSTFKHATLLKKRLRRRCFPLTFVKL